MVRAKVISENLLKRKEKRVISLLKKVIGVALDLLYDEGYLDEDHDEVEVKIIIKSDVPDNLS
ncbi:MAG: hypothetical protein J6A59_03780 [Lachnospiraceae bacterium]|nr:hypothetical protein [Lachnospiraceae bacterium]